MRRPGRPYRPVDVGAPTAEVDDLRAILGGVLDGFGDGLQSRSQHRGHCGELDLVVEAHRRDTTDMGAMPWHLLAAQLVRRVGQLVAVQVVDEAVAIVVHEVVGDLLVVHPQHVGQGVVHREEPRVDHADGQPAAL